MAELVGLWLIRARFETAEPLHLGGAAPAGFVEQPLDVVERNGSPVVVLSGDTVAGWLRERALVEAIGYRQAEPRGGPAAEVQAVFGGTAGDADGDQSALVAHDTYIPASGLSVVDRIAIDPDRAVAAEHAKWETEVVNPGATFDVWLELPLFDDGEPEADLLAMLASGLDATHGCLGSGANRGSGEVRLLGVAAQRVDYTDPAAVLAWHGQLLAHGPADGVFPIAGPDRLSARAAFAGTLAPGGAGHPPKVSNRMSMSITIPVEFPSGIIVGSEDPAAGADSTALMVGNDHLLPGWSCGGYRQAARRAASAGISVSVEELFGPERPTPGVIGRGDVLEASRLQIRTSRLSGGTLVTVPRVRIDDFTGGAVDHALFDAGVLFGATAELCFSLPLDSGWTAARQARACLELLGLAWDTCLCGTPFGGDVAVGRGEPRVVADGRITGIRGIRIELTSPLRHGPLAGRSLEIVVGLSSRTGAPSLQLTSPAGFEEWLDDLERCSLT